jgi:hypothetical protein
MTDTPAMVPDFTPVPVENSTDDPALGGPPNEKPDGSGPAVRGMTEAERTGQVGEVAVSPSSPTLLGDHPDAGGDVPGKTKTLDIKQS